MNSIEYELQVQILNRLKNDPDIQARGLQVYDVVPATASYPYISIDEITGSPYGSKTFDGLDVLVTISTLSSKAGKAETLHMLGIVRRAMREFILMRDNHLIDLQSLETIDIEEYTDESAAVYSVKRGVLVFRFLVKEGS